MKIIKQGFTLRPLRVSDLKGFFETMQDLETQKNLESFPKNLQEAKKELLDMLREVRIKGFEIFTIEIKKKYAGNIILQYQNWDKNSNEGRVHLWIHSNFRGNGLGTKALNEVLKYGFKTKFNKIYAQCKATNKGAIKINTKLGFKKVKTYVNEKGIKKILWVKMK